MRPGAAPRLRPKVASVATERISASLPRHQLDTILSWENDSPLAEDTKALHEHIGGHHEDNAGEDAGEHAFLGCHADGRPGQHCEDGLQKREVHQGAGSIPE